MKKEVQDKGRNFVVITDPHLKRDHSYRVYTSGLEKTDKWEQSKYTSIYVKQRNGNDLKGHCWPGDSVWVNYFNEGARKFWSQLYSFENFRGTDDSFHIWLDMNEPSVFNGPENTMPKDAVHILTDGSSI